MAADVVHFRKGCENHRKTVDQAVLEEIIQAARHHRPPLQLADAHLAKHRLVVAHDAAGVIPELHPALGQAGHLAAARTHFFHPERALRGEGRDFENRGGRGRGRQAQGEAQQAGPKQVQISFHHCPPDGSWRLALKTVRNDSSLKNPISALRCISKSLGVNYYASRC